MKRALFIGFMLVATVACAQNYPDYGLSKVHISDTDRTVEAEIYPLSRKPSVKSGLFYYWYNANLIHTTQGGYSGKLLNGQYTEFYLNKNLKEQGVFKKGLKDGVWKSWNKDGTIKQTEKWKNGVLIKGDRPTFMEKLNVFKKRKGQSTDTAKMNQ